MPSPATFDYEKLDWMNGVYLRDLQPDEYAHDLCEWLAEQGIDWPMERVHATVPLVQEKIEKFSQYPDFVRFLFEPVDPPDGVDPELCRAARRAARGGRAVGGDARSRRRCARWRRSCGLKPRDAFQPIRLAITGSKVSPGLFESLELLGREESRSPGSARPWPPERPGRGERVERPLERAPGLEAEVKCRTRKRGSAAGALRAPCNCGRDRHSRA